MFASGGRGDLATPDFLLEVIGSSIAHCAGTRCRPNEAGVLNWELAEGPVANPGNSTVFRDRHQTTDKCLVTQKLIRFSADAPRAGFSYVLAESGLGLRERINRPEIGGRIRTIFGARLCDWGACRHSTFAGSDPSGGCRCFSLCRLLMNRMVWIRSPAISNTATCTVRLAPSEGFTFADDRFPGADDSGYSLTPLWGFQASQS